MLTKIKQYQKIIMERVTQLRDMRTVGVLLFLVVLLLITWSGVKAINANFGLQKQISKLEQQNAVKKLSNQNAQLQNAYYNTPQYLELAARQDFGLAAPGETVLVVPRGVALAQTVDLSPQTKQVAEAKKPVYQRNLAAWKDFFLHREHPEDEN